jgi:DNA-nicking Smr family endonuclease
MTRRRRTDRFPRFHVADGLHDAAVASELDLHGFRADEVPTALRNFLTSWQRRGRGLVVHVITGRGRSSANGPVLRGRVAALLKGELAPLVADWGPDESDGGFKVKLR